MTSLTPPAKPSPPKRISIQGVVCSHLSRKKPIAPPTTTAPTSVKGSSMARPAFTVISRASFSAGVSFSGSLESSAIEELLFKEQFAGTLSGLHHGFDQRYAQLPFFELEDTVNRATGGRRHCVF